MSDALTQAFGTQAALAASMLTALGGGMLIGLERERHKGRGQSREPAGLRTFAITALGGALAQGLDAPGLVAVGALAVALLVALAYALGRGKDPGLTTEIALVVTYLIGVLCVPSPALGASAAVLLTVLLAARTRLHRFATTLLREDELHDGLLLAALALVILPLMPTEPLHLLAGLKAYSLVSLLLLLLAMQALGHIALRMLGPQAGLALSGLLSGLVSSTATIAAMGSRARAQPSLLRACAAGAVMSTAATWLLAGVMLMTIAPQQTLWFLPIGLGCIALAAGIGALLAWHVPARHPAPSVEAPHKGGALRLREALLVALLLSGVTIAVAAAQQQFGSTGLFAVVAVSALADAHAPMASLAALAGTHEIGPHLLSLGLLLAIGCNSLTRSITAVLTGGWRFGALVVAALASTLALAAAMRWAILAAPA